MMSGFSATIHSGATLGYAVSRLAATFSPLAISHNWCIPEPGPEAL